MSRAGKIFTAVCTVMLISGFVLGHIGDNQTREKVRAELHNFGQYGKVVDTYILRSGNVRKNYRYHSMAVLENKNGDRLSFPIAKHLPVTGDCWNIGIEEDHGLNLKLLNRTNKENCQ